MDEAAEGELLAKWLVSRRLVRSPAVDRARHEALTRGGRIATILVEHGAVDLATIAKALGAVHGVPALGPEAFKTIDEKVAEALPARVALRALAVPVARGQTGISFAFVDPGEPAAIAAVQRDASANVVVCVAPEPLIYARLRSHYGMTKLPRRIGEIVDRLEGKAPPVSVSTGAVPSDAQEYITTPMGGMMPSLPDETSTAGLGGPEGNDLLSTDEILYGRGRAEDSLGAAQGALSHARDKGSVAAAVLEYCAGILSAAVVLEKSGEEFIAIAGIGALERSRVVVDASKPSVLDAAASGQSGFVGALPQTPANRAVAKAIGREAVEVLLLPLSLKRGAEILLYADAGNSKLDPALVERLRTLAKRARQALD